jgi:hypothetical protein
MVNDQELPLSFSSMPAKAEVGEESLYTVCDEGLIKPVLDKLVKMESISEAPVAPAPAAGAAAAPPSVATAPQEETSSPQQQQQQQQPQQQQQQPQQQQQQWSPLQHFSSRDAPVARPETPGPSRAPAPTPASAEEHLHTFLGLITDPANSIPDGLRRKLLRPVLSLGALAVAAADAVGSRTITAPPPSTAAAEPFHLLNSSLEAMVSLKILAFTSATMLRLRFGDQTFYIDSTRCMIDTGNGFVAVLGDYLAQQLLTAGVPFAASPTVATGATQGVCATQMSASVTLEVSHGDSTLTVLDVHLIWVVGCEIRGIILGVPLLQSLNSSIDLFQSGCSLNLYGPEMDWGLRIPLSNPGCSRDGHTSFVSRPPAASFAASATDAASRPSSAGGGEGRS